MEYHPHLHLLSIGGGLAGEGCWCEKKDGFFLPAEVVSPLFRGKFLAGLRALMEENGLVFEGGAAKYRNRYKFQELLNACYKKNWVTFLKESFAGAETVMEYLGRYTHRIAISNSRILSMDEETVTFKTKDSKNGGIWKETTLLGVEFVRRFLMHVLPKRFVKIRHYGLFQLLQDPERVEKMSKDEIITLRDMLIQNIAFITEIARVRFDISDNEMTDIRSFIAEQYKKLK